MSLKLIIVGYLVSTLKRLTFLIVCTTLLSSKFFGQHNHNLLESRTGHKDLVFIENIGQFDPEVKFKATVKYDNIFIQDDGITFDYSNKKDYYDYKTSVHQHDNSLLPKALRRHAYKVVFVNSLQNLNPQGSHSLEEFHNYYLGSDSSKWVSNVSLFKGVVSKNVFQNIDVSYYSKNGHLKYDFILKNGADPSDIALMYEGLDNIKIHNNNLLLRTSVNTITEVQPYAYQVIQGDLVEVSCEYLLEGNIVSFDLGNYDSDYDLIIDPIVLASTYAGSTNEVFGYCGTFDEYDNIYGGGLLLASTGFPTIIGAYMLTPQGNTDMCIQKLDPNGNTRVYSTYLGGNNEDTPISLICENGELFIFGTSKSTNYPTTSGAYDQTHNGKIDVVISKLSSDGANLLASTYIGGTENDGYNSNISPFYSNKYKGEIVLDVIGFVYVATVSHSQNFPSTTSAFQSSPGGKQDGVIFKFNNSLSSLIASSYIGGPEDDGAFGIEVDSTEVYITGDVASSGVFNFNGSYNPLFTGPLDGFVAKFDANLKLLNGTFINFGTASVWSSFVKKDLLGNVYITGNTSGVISSSLGYYQGPGNGTFITKFDASFSKQEFVVKTGQILPAAFLVDDCGAIYLSGHNFTDPVYGVDTLNAVQSNPAGFYVMILKPNAQSLDFASHYGSNRTHIDGGMSRFNRDGVLYQAVCDDIGFPVLPNAVSNYMAAGDFDLAHFKIDPETQTLTRSEIKTDTSNTGCLPLSLNFDNKGNGNLNIWNFNDGSPLDSSNNPVHIFNKPGVFETSLITIDTSGYCSTINSDTSYSKIEVLDTATVQALFFINDSVFCEASDIAIINRSSGNNWIWNFGDGSSFENTYLPEHQFLNRGTYLINLTAIDTSNYCAEKGQFSKKVQIHTSIELDANFTVSYDNNGCFPIEVKFEYSGLASGLKWDLNGATSTDFMRNSSTYTKSGLYSVFLYVSDSLNHCSVSDSSFHILDFTTSGDQTIYIPNSFTPNDDIINQTFSPKFSGSFNQYSLQIFNRWGKRLFSSESIENGWNGEYEGLPEPQGVYVYKVSYFDNCMDKGIEKIGHICLIR